MPEFIRIPLLCLLVLAAPIACREPTPRATATLPPEQLFWALTIDHKAVNLSTVAPTNTLRLIAVPRNVYGEPLPDAPVATFRSAAPTDASVTVLPDGTIIGRSQTSTTGLRVIAQLSYGGVTRIDTAFVVVTNSVTPPTLRTFSIQMAVGDSAKIAASQLYDPRTKALPKIAKDTAGNPIPRAIYFFESSNSLIASVNRQTGVVTTGTLLGDVVIRARVMMYGVAMQDSLVLTVTDPLVQIYALRNLGPQRTAHLTAGGEIVWWNLSPDSLDIVFDDPDAASVGGVTALWMAMRDTSGNIGIFASDTLSGVGITLKPKAIRVRSFRTRGTYQWRSLRHPELTGSIVVR